MNGNSWHVVPLATHFVHAATSDTRGLYVYTLASYMPGLYKHSCLVVSGGPGSSAWDRWSRYFSLS